MLTNEELLKHAVKFGFGKVQMHRKPEAYKYYIVNCELGLDKWKITQDDEFCYSDEERDFVYEPLPSSRTVEFLKSTRFSLEEAIKIVEELLGEIN